MSRRFHCQQSVSFDVYSGRVLLYDIVFHCGEVTAESVWTMLFVVVILSAVHQIAVTMEWDGSGQ